jgi:dihydroflavonol-4-reductase
MKVLVTGGTGFIGSNLIEKLVSRNYEVYTIAKDNMNIEFLNSLNVKLLEYDLNNLPDLENELHDVDYIYHLAGVTRAINKNDYYLGNFLATRNLLKVCKQSCKKLKRFVYLSSLSAVGPSVDGKPVDEETPYHPVSHYGKSKMMGELEVIRSSNKFPITILRPGSVYGPREKDMFEYFKLVKFGIKPIIGFNQKKLNLIFCGDLVDSIIEAGEHPKAVNEVYFVGSEQAYTNHQIGEAIALAQNKSTICIRIPHLIVYTIGLIEEIFGKILRRPVFLNLHKAKESIQERWDCSIQKIKNEIGFHPKVSLSKGMERTFEWYVAEEWL